MKLMWNPIHSRFYLSEVFPSEKGFSIRTIHSIHHISKLVCLISFKFHSFELNLRSEFCDPNLGCSTMDNVKFIMNLC